MTRCAWCAVALVAGCARPAGSPSLAPARERAPLPLLVRQTSGTTALLQAVSVVNDSVAWVSGHRGTWLRTTNGGATWEAGRVPGADTLQFRDVFAASPDTAWLLSAGNGALSRIYRTTDGGRQWALQFENADARAFYDCLDFWDSRRGLAFSDAVDGRFPVLLTDDGGAHWRPATGLPPALPGEGGFAASGTCVVAGAGGRAWIGTGNAARSRVLITRDYGRSWRVSEIPIPAAPAAGVASLAFRDPQHGLAGGGLVSRPDSAWESVATTADGGERWQLPPVGDRARFPPIGAVFGLAWLKGGEGREVLAVGPRGAALSLDGGQSWTAVDTAAYWAAGAAPSGGGWMVGPGGRITRIILR